MDSSSFDILPEAYEAMIDWPKRLMTEEPLYRRLFQRVGAKRVLDVACGTGHHVAMFHSWGVEVEGADVSDPMIRWCQKHYGQSPSLNWVVRGFHQPVLDPGSFDVAICTGNSLALASELDVIGLAIQEMLAAVRTGGAILIHVLNLWRLPDGPCQWQKCLRTHLSWGDTLIIKGVRRCGTHGYVDVIATELAAAPKMHAESAAFWGLEAADLEAMAREAGASHVEVFGGYKRQLYDRQSSQDLILLAIR